ncbi:MAG: OmpA family protein [Nitrospiraceae bacterium]|nr:MAG: OmpA family protein [Nitrospiraceae bacterium]
MRKNRKRVESHDNVERWMVSYADFVTLLFCFFTAMYAISTVDTNKLEEFASSMKAAFNEGEKITEFSVIDDVQVILPTSAETESSIRQMLSAIIKESDGSLDVKRDSRGIVIAVADKMLYTSGSADLKEGAVSFLDLIVQALIEFPNPVRIEGHTDNIPIHTKEFPSNWELSASRAINVAKYFVEKHNIDPVRITSIGYAEHKPVASNDSPEGRAKNRRVDIVLLSEQESRKEPY